MVDIKKEKNMSIKELQETIEQMILCEYQTDAIPSDIEVRRKYYKRLKLLIGLDKFLTHHQIHIIQNANKGLSFSGAKLFTCTTGGKNDLKSIFSILNHPAWLPVITPEYCTDFETFLYRNHFITWYNKADEKMKTALLDRQIKTLLQGEDLICFPEIEKLKSGEVADLNPGYADIIVDTSPVIIPIAIEEYHKKDSTINYINIGRYFDLKGLKKAHKQDIITIIIEELNKLKKETRNIAEDHLSNSKTPIILNDTDTSDISRHLLIKK